jgi:predicted metal-binding membrane protein
VVGVSIGAPALRQITLPASVLLVVAACAWLVVIDLARGMAAMPGTMGLSFGAFVGVWSLMMTAMMLPSIVPFTALYTRTLTGHRPRRIAGLAGGYLLVWSLAAGPGYILAWFAGRLAGTQQTAAKVMAVAIFAACGIYQLTPVKDRCLARCRSPLGFVLKYGSYRGQMRDLRVGISHGAFCLACCWALMAILVATGLMNLAVMVLLAAVVLAEKTWRWGPALGRLTGVAALILAVAVVFRPG